ncbi:tetratricopeptide repeat protein [Sphingomonas sanxanigenens]|uniref:tetratricopeptide repeat protein n=1 Tax=Sphingomonas sanxanigenens TaxID=397260 RepID=UPI00130179D4|nr:SEL1-like repeat protein [Sphingomonas sanxanigenens]
MTDVGDLEKTAYKLIKNGDYEAAVKVLITLSELDSSYALLSLGWIYDSGKIGISDSRRAAKYYEKAAMLGSGSGFFELGRLRYDEGNLVESRRIFSDGSNIGDIRCLAWYGSMMAKGEGGEKNVEEAIKILEVASEGGQLIAKRVLIGLKIDSSDSLLMKLFLYMKIIPLSLLAVYEAIRDPYSDRGYR